MTIALKNPTRQPANYTLTLDCITPELPATVGIRMKTVYGESYPHRPALIAETVKFPPTITISARETIKGLPDAVVFAPEIQNAVAAKHLVIITEAAAENVYTRPTVDPDPDHVAVKGVHHPAPTAPAPAPESVEGSTAPTRNPARSSAAGQATNRAKQNQ